MAAVAAGPPRARGGATAPPSRRDRRRREARAFARPAPIFREMDALHLVESAANALMRIEGRVRILEDDLHDSPASEALGPARPAGQLDALERDPPGRRRLEPDQHPRDRRLARARLADDSQRAARLERERRPPHRVHLLPLPGELPPNVERLLELLDDEEWRLLRHRLAPWAGADHGSPASGDRPTRLRRHGGEAEQRRCTRPRGTRNADGKGSRAARRSASAVVRE